MTTFHRLYGLNEAEIVTYSESRTIETDGLTIRIRPLAEWLLEFKDNYLPPRSPLPPH